MSNNIGKTTGSGYNYNDEKNKKNKDVNINPCIFNILINLFIKKI